VQNELRTLVATIESIKKEIDKEMHRHEELTARRDKISYELAECSKAGTIILKYIFRCRKIFISSNYFKRFSGK